MRSRLLIMLCILLISSCKKSAKENRTPYSDQPRIPLKTTVSYEKSSAKGNYKRARKGRQQCLETAHEYNSRLAMEEKSIYTPFYRYQLGTNLLRLNHYSNAYDNLYPLCTLSVTTSFPKIKRMESMRELQDISYALTLRTLAIGGYNNAFEELAKDYTPHFDDARLHFAYALLLMGKKDAAVKACEDAVDTANYRRLYKRSSITAGVAHILYALNEKEKLQELTQWMIDLGPIPEEGTYMRYDKEGEPDAYFLNQWQSSYNLVQRFRTLPHINAFSDYPDGTYKATVRGFIDSLSVDVILQDSKISTISVTASKDDRPFSALESIAQRIISRQSIEVDAVTEATVTSTAIIAATVEALHSSKK